MFCTAMDTLNDDLKEPPSTDNLQEVLLPPTKPSKSIIKPYTLQILLFGDPKLLKKDKQKLRRGPDFPESSGRL